MLTIYDALLLEWFFYFHHLPTLMCQTLSPSQISFWSDLVAWGTQSLFQDTKDCSCPLRTWCVYMRVGVRGFKESIDSIISSPLNPCCTPSDASWLIHSLWPIISFGTCPCFPRLPISSAWSSNSKTEKCFPKEMSDITSFSKLFILSLAHATPSKFNSLCERDLLNICPWIKLVLNEWWHLAPENSPLKKCLKIYKVRSYFCLPTTKYKERIFIYTVCQDWYNGLRQGH